MVIKRESNIELLRIICMMLIIAHHSVVHGGILGIDNCVNKYIGLLILPSGKIMFVTFIVISTWFLADKDFKLERFLKTWLQVLFYSVLFAVLAAAYGNNLSWHNWISVFFPIIGNSHGFAATYLAFYLSTPFLAILNKTMTQKQHLCLGGGLLYFEVISIFMKGIFDYQGIMLSSELTLFIFIYFVTAYIKKYTTFYRHNTTIFGVISVIIWLIISGIYLLSFSKYGQNEVLGILRGLCNDETSILYLIGGYCVFFVFINIKIPYNVIINKIAHVSFGVLLFHDHNFFRYILWRDILHAEEFYHSHYFVVWVIATALLIYAVGYVIDSVREWLFKYISLQKLAVNIMSKYNNFLPCSEGRKV